MTKPPKKFLLKDQLFNRENVHHLAELLKSAYPKFDLQKFEKEVLSAFPQLELKERMTWVREKFTDQLPDDYLKTLKILIKSIEQEPEKFDFIFAAYPDYVAALGCKKQYLEQSLAALGDFTHLFSAEFAIRPFINQFPKETFKQMKLWSLSKNNHQRRLASEGFRPKLPWAKAINFDYKKAASILDNLYYDQDRYITRSVANHLNDISKLDHLFVLEKLATWTKSKKQKESEIKYMTQHALRTSVKRGDKETLNFLGYGSNPKIGLDKLKIKNKNISLGQSLEFSFELNSKSDENLMIDYCITYATPHKRISTKVFKIKKLHISADGRAKIEKRHPFKLMSTKRLYSGEHKVEIQINGSIIASESFILKT
jgi:3-methyladenine DNA glycosylase AlkC